MDVLLLSPIEFHQPLNIPESDCMPSALVALYGNLDSSTKVKGQGRGKFRIVEVSLIIWGGGENICYFVDILYMCCPSTHELSFCMQTFVDTLNVLWHVRHQHRIVVTFHNVIERHEWRRSRGFTLRECALSHTKVYFEFCCQSSPHYAVIPIPGMLKVESLAPYDNKTRVYEHSGAQLWPDRDRSQIVAGFFEGELCTRMPIGNFVVFILWPACPLHQ